VGEKTREGTTKENSEKTTPEEKRSLGRSASERTLLDGTTEKRFEGHHQYN
jgi:hypothetical protein